MADDPKPTDPVDDPKPKDDLGDAGKKALDAERKARREADAKLKEAEAELEKLRSDSDSSKTELDKALERISDMEKRLTESDRRVLVAEVAQAKKLPAAIAGRLTGSTKEELEADADVLIEALGLGKDDPEEPAGAKPDGATPQGPGGRPKEKLTPGASTPDDDAVDGEKLAEQIFSSRNPLG
jgi:hypothetical protein